MLSDIMRSKTWTRAVIFMIIGLTVLFCNFFIQVAIFFDKQDYQPRLVSLEPVNVKSDKDAHETNNAHEYDIAVPLALIICKDSGDFTSVDPADKRLTWQRQKEQFQALLGSMLYMSNFTTVTVYIFTESIQTFTELILIFNEWPKIQQQRLHFEMREIETERFQGNRFQWRPCAWGKMFLPIMLEDHDSVIYLDSDIIFLGPLEDMWKVFPRMNESQSIAAAAEMWYVEENDHRPAAGTNGINTGVLLLNLTRLRADLPDGLGSTLMQVPNIVPEPRHDQDVLNAFLKQNPEMLYELPARYNFLPSSCLDYAPMCKECYDRGILLLHGADSSFYRLVDAKSMEVYRAMLRATRRLETPLDTLAEELEEAVTSIDRGQTKYLYMCQHYDNYDEQLLLHVRTLTDSRV